MNDKQNYTNKGSSALGVRQNTKTTIQCSKNISFLLSSSAVQQNSSPAHISPTQPN
jgi:hypothetical protein